MQVKLVFILTSKSFKRDNKLRSKLDRLLALKFNDDNKVKYDKSIVSILFLSNPNDFNDVFADKSMFEIKLLEMLKISSLVF